MARADARGVAQAFLTAIKQTTARRDNLALDLMDLLDLMVNQVLLVNQERLVNQEKPFLETKELR